MILLSAIAISVSLMLLVHFMSKKHEAQQKAKARQRNSSPSHQPQPPFEKTLPGIERVTTWLDTLRKFREEYTWADNVVIGVIALALIHIGAGIIFESNYGAYMWRKEVIFFQIAMGMGFSMLVKKKDAKPPRHILGVLVILMAIIVTGKMFFSSNKKDSPPSSTNAQAATRSKNFIIPNGTPDCFKEKLGPDKDAAYAAFPGQMDLMAVFCRESRFNHMDPEDTTKVYVHKNIDEQTKQVTSVDWGIAQINSAHDAELTRLGLDKNKREDNLKYAGILYDKNGLKDWIPKIGEKLVFEVEVSDEYSKTFKMPQIDPSERPFNYGFKWSKGTLVMAIDDESRIVTVGNGANLGYPKNYKLKSGEAGEKILVTITYQY